MLSILERPLTTIRGNGKSCIYSNFNPKYAQLAIPILQTYSNFCFAIKLNGTIETPAQRLGITDEKFGLNDIVYLRWFAKYLANLFLIRGNGKFIKNECIGVSMEL